MKNKLVIASIAGAAILLMAIIFGAPWAIGFLLQNRINLASEVINSQNLPFTVTISDYHRGWFTSSATIQVSSEDSPQTLVSLPMKIYHGPIIYYNNRLHLALGNYSSEIKTSSVQGEIKGWLSLTSHLYSQIHFDPNKIKQGDNFAQLGAVDINCFIPLNSLAEVQADVRVNQLDGQMGSLFTGNLNDMEYRVDGKRQADSSWNWAVSVGLGNSYFALQNPLNGQIEKISWQTIKLQNLVANSYKINQFAAALQNLDDRHLMQNTEAMISAMINPGSRIQIEELKGDFNILTILANLDVTWPDLPQQHTFKDVITYQTLQLYFQVPNINYQDAASGVSIQLNNFNLQENYTRQQGMQATLKLADLTVKNQHAFTVKNLNWRALSDASAVNNTWQASLLQFCSDQNCFDNSNLNAVVDNINSSAAPDSFYQDFSQALDQFNQNNDMKVWQTFLQNDIAPQLNAKSLIKWNFSTETPHGSSRFASFMSWPDFKAGAEVLNSTLWHMSISLPNYYLDQLLQYKNNPGNIAYPNSLGLDTNSQIANFLGQWLQNDYIINQDQHYTLTLSLKNGQLSLQNKLMNALNLGYLAFYLGWYPLSLQQFIVAADNGDRNGQFYVGLQYALGLSVKKNTQTAIKWLSRSAKQNYSNAALILGGLYYKGSQVQVDYLQAKYWFKLGATQNDPRAQTALGDLYAAGSSNPKAAPDYPQAAYWYNLAAQQNYAPAEYRLGQCYENGQGVAQDLNKAYSLYQAAASQHFRHASQAADSVAQKLSREKNGD